MNGRRQRSNILRKSEWKKENKQCEWKFNEKNRNVQDEYWKWRREGIREKKFEINKLNVAKKNRSSKKEKKWRTVSVAKKSELMKGRK